MKALRIPTTGPVHVVELAPPEDDDATALLATLHAATGCHSVECVRLAMTWELWVDETGKVDGAGFNQRATLLAHSYGYHQSLYGDAVAVGAHEDTGDSVGLTDAQAEAIGRRIAELHRLGTRSAAPRARPAGSGATRASSVG
jgi:uncharacterized protein DUF3846